MTKPSISLIVTGKQGEKGWFVSDVTITPVVNDTSTGSVQVATSGIATVEATKDGGPWTMVNSPSPSVLSPLSFSDGYHSYQFRVTDVAGNSTTIPVQNIKIDTVAPSIDMTESVWLGKSVYYEIVDPSTGSGLAGATASGLSLMKAVIEDDAEKYKKITWDDNIGGSEKIQDSILWDGNFEGVRADNGDYFITLKVKDQAGNESMRTAIVQINLTSIFVDPPVFDVPVDDTPVDNGVKTDDTPVDTGGVVITFEGEDNTGIATDPQDVTVTEEGGGNNNILENGIALITTVGGEIVNWAEGLMTSIETFVESEKTETVPIDSGNILWGLAAAALVGSTRAQWEKEREEERIRKAQEAAAKWREEHPNADGEDDPGRDRANRRAAQRAQDASVRARWAEQAKPVYIPSQKLEVEETNWLKSLTPAAQYEKRKEEAAAKAATAKQQTLNDYHAGEHASYTVPEGKPVDEKPWWRGIIDYATTGIQSAVTTYQLRGINVTPLESGKVSVNASSLPKGTRANYFSELSKGEEFVFRPGPYLTSTLLT